MKNFLLTTSVGVLLIAGTSRVHAQFLSPRIPDGAVPVAKAAPPVAVVSSNVLIVSNDDDSGPGSLRYAISNAAPGDTIQFALGSKRLFGLPIPAVIALKSGLVIDKDLTIAGPGPLQLAVVRSSSRRTPPFSVFQVSTGTVTISGLTIGNGRAINPDGRSDNLGGGILNFDTLTVSNCIVTHNEARTEAGGVGYGGGVFSAGPLTLLNSTFSDNEVSGAGGGVSVFHSLDFHAEGCTFSGNEAEVQGGGINFQGTLGHIKNCTVSGNRTGERGAASGILHLVFPAEVSGLDISATTVTRNKGETETNGAVTAAALPGSIGLITRLINTLVANNEPHDFARVNATFQSLGHNLDGDGSSGFVNGANGDIVGTETNSIDARLGSLSFNGGPTRTHALRFGSPAVDAGICSDAEGAPLTNDQRGFPRPQGAACDIRAFENQPPTLTCPPAGTNDCSASLSVLVSDPEGDPLTLVWTVDGTDVQTNTVTNASSNEPRKVKLKLSLAPGAHTIGVRVTDGKAPVVTCSTVITIQDMKAPRIKSIKADPRRLWPPDGRLVPVTLDVRVSDCSPVDCRIISVESSDPVGNEPDWEITGNLTVNLRAERSGRRDRVYTITVECRDAVGNTSQDTVKVRVSKHSDDDDDDHHDRDRDHDGDDDDDDDDDSAQKQAG